MTLTTSRSYSGYQHAKIADEQAAKVLGPRTGLKDFDVIGQEFGLLWIEQIGGDHQFYGLHFPFESPFGDPWGEVVMRYSQLPFIKFATVFYPIPVEQNRYGYEKVLITIKEEATVEMEAIWAASVLPSGDRTLDEQRIVLAREHRTGLPEFDALWEQFGLLWIERTYGGVHDSLARKLYGLHFPLGSPLETIMAAYARLPFVERASPGLVPIELADDTEVEVIAWGRIKHQTIHLVRGRR